MNDMLWLFMKMQLLLGTARRESESLRAELERERAALARERAELAREREVSESLRVSLAAVRERQGKELVVHPGETPRRRYKTVAHKKAVIQDDEGSGSSNDGGDEDEDTAVDDLVAEPDD